MFNNIGKKIKSLAVFVTWIGIIASIVSGMAIMTGGGEMIIIGIILIIVGGIASWVSSFLLYGFGELIEKICLIDERQFKHVQDQKRVLHRIETLLEDMDINSIVHS